MSARDEHRPAPRRRGLRAWIARFLGDERAAVSPILVLAIVPIIGALGMGTEASNWWLTQRALQNAADSAVIAAATNNGTTCSGGTTACTATSYTSGCATSPGDYDCEAVAAAAGEGVVNGSGNVSVYPQYLTSGCPGTLSSCYQVTITRSLPIHLLSLVGYRGANGSQIVTASAVGGVHVGTTADCILSLATSGNGITTDGSPNVNLEGCSIQANSTGSSNPNYSGKCNGHNLNADYFSSPGTDNGCGNTAINGASPVADPYNYTASGGTNTSAENCNTALAAGSGNCQNANIPPDLCSGSYPQESNSNLMTANMPSSVSTIGTAYPGHAGYYYVCGDVQLQTNVTLASNETLVIYNGMLDLNGHTLSSGSTNTSVIFTGQDTFSFTTTGKNPKTITITPFHILAGSGTLEIEAPTSGAWSGIALYQSPVQVTSSGVTATSLDDLTVQGSTKSLDVTAAGSSPNLWVQGAFYFPRSNFTVSGSIDNFQGLTSNGCFLLIANVVNLNGQGSIFQNAQTQCSNDGVTQVFGAAYSRVLFQ